MGKNPFSITAMRVRTPELPRQRGSENPVWIHQKLFPFIIYATLLALLVSTYNAESHQSSDPVRVLWNSAEEGL